MSEEAIVIFKHNNLQMHLKTVEVLLSHKTQTLQIWGIQTDSKQRFRNRSASYKRTTWEIGDKTHDRRFKKTYADDLF